MKLDIAAAVFIVCVVLTACTISVCMRLDESVVLDRQNTNAIRLEIRQLRREVAEYARFLDLPDAGGRVIPGPGWRPRPGGSFGAPSDLDLDPQEDLSDIPDELLNSTIDGDE